QMTDKVHHTAGAEGLVESTYDQFWILGEQRVHHCNQYYYCVTTQGNLWRYIGKNHLLAVLSLLISYFLGWMVYAKLLKAIKHYHSLPSRIQRGLRHRSFYPLFQPIVSLQTQQVVGCEVLARFCDHDGDVYPDQFIPVVASCNLSWPFTKMMVEQSLQALDEVGMDNSLSVSFNIFPRDISNGAVLSLLNMPSVMGWSGKITLELTENEEFEEADAQASLRRLKEAGMDIAIDDFGTGYSNLKYIDKLHCRYLKIDRTFVMDVEEGSIRSSIIPHIVSIAEKAQLIVVAEGVENHAQVQALADMGVKYVQGFYFGKPMSASQLNDLVASGSPQIQGNPEI
ncbi:MAG TPA: EAL domain-containing protein, partial [Cellvibrionaceae bacterium]